VYVCVVASTNKFDQQVMPSYKLTYFDIRGLAENARILFAAAKQPYEDVRLSLSFGTPGDFSTIQRGLERLNGWGTSWGTWNLAKISVYPLVNIQKTMEKLT